MSYFNNDVLYEYLGDNDVLEATDVIETEVDRMLENSLNDVTFTNDNEGEIVDDAMVSVFELLSDEYGTDTAFDYDVNDDLKSYVETCYAVMRDNEIDDLLRDVRDVMDGFKVVVVAVVQMAPEGKDLPEDYINFILNENNRLDVDEDPMETFEAIYNVMRVAGRLLDTDKDTLPRFGEFENGIAALERLYEYRMDY